MKTLLTLAIFGTLGAVVACSSSSSSDDAGTGGGDTGGSTTGGAASGGAASGGAASGGAASGGAASGGAASGGSATGGGSNPDAVVLDCGSHTYTAVSPSTGAGCDTVIAPESGGINDFETEEKATWMRHYAQGTPAGTSTDPATFTDGDAAGVNRIAGGGNGTAYSIHYKGTGWVGSGDDGDDGIRVSSSFPTCQDVRTYSGVSFWAKGSTGASTDWGGIAEDTVILFLNDGTTSIDTRVALTGGDTWTEYRVPFNCVGDTTQPSKFEGYVKSFDIQFHAPSFDIAVDEIAFY